MILEILAFFFATAYLFLNGYLYKNLIYPGLYRVFYRGPIDNSFGVKRDLVYLVGMTIGWLLVLATWLLYLFGVALLLRFGANQNVLTFLTAVCGLSLITYVSAVSFPKQIGSWITGTKWSAQ